MRLVRQSLFMALKVIKKGTYQPISPLLKEGIKNVSAQNCEWAQLLSHVLLLVAPWNVQAPLSMEFSRQ